MTRARTRPVQGRLSIGAPNAGPGLGQTSVPSRTAGTRGLDQQLAAPVRLPDRFDGASVPGCPVRIEIDGPVVADLPDAGPVPHWHPLRPCRSPQKPAACRSALVRALRGSVVGGRDRSASVPLVPLAEGETHTPGQVPLVLVCSSSFLFVLVSLYAPQTWVYG